MNFPHLIASIERTIEMEKEKAAQRQMMLANKDNLVFSEKLPVLNSPEFMAELEAVLPLLKRLSMPIEELKMTADLSPLYLKMFNCMETKHYVKNANKVALELTEIAQKFFHQYRPKP